MVTNCKKSVTILSSPFTLTLNMNTLFSNVYHIFQVFSMQTFWVQEVKRIKKREWTILHWYEQNAYQLQINIIKHFNWYHWNGLDCKRDTYDVFFLLDNNTFYSDTMTNALSSRNIVLLYLMPFLITFLSV